MDRAREGLVFGLLTAEEQKELREAHKAERIIEYYHNKQGAWIPTAWSPNWDAGTAYRIAPEPEKELVFVPSGLADCEKCALNGKPCGKYPCEAWLTPTGKSGYYVEKGKEPKLELQFPKGFRFVEIKRVTPNDESPATLAYDHEIYGSCAIEGAINRADFAGFGYVARGKVVIRDASVGYLDKLTGEIYSEWAEGREIVRPSYVAFREG